MTRYSFTVQGKPQPKQRPRVVNRGGFARAYTPKQTKDYEKVVADAFKTKYPDHEPTDKPVTLALFIAVQPPKSISQKKRIEMLDRGYPLKKPDIDNVLKTVADSLNGVLYVDDSQVCEMIVKKYYAESDSISVIAEIVV